MCVTLLYKAYNIVPSVHSIFHILECQLMTGLSYLGGWSQHLWLQLLELIGGRSGIVLLNLTSLNVMLVVVVRKCHLAFTVQSAFELSAHLQIR